MASSARGLRLVFAGTPDFAAYHLQALLASHHQLVAVYTQPDRPAGRGKKLSPSPVKRLALDNNLPVFQPLSLKDPHAQQTLAAHNADVMIVVAYGLLLPQVILSMPRFGCLNVHGSLLPRWRGAAPIQRAVEAGDTLSGITIMQMDVGLDTGPMLYKSECELSATETSASLHNKLMHLGPPALLATLEQLQQGQLKPLAQDNSAATYAAKITKEEALIEWKQSAVLIERYIRSYNPFPIAYSFLGNQRVKIYAATIIPLASNKTPGEIIAFDQRGLLVACGQQSIMITQLQLPGKKVMAASELLHGYSELFAVGHNFGE
jgi:methionyl-tRNA formyltransferase